MPAVSERQRRYIFWKFGPQWARAHHFDTKGPLPEHVIHRAIKARQQRRRG